MTCLDVLLLLVGVLLSILLGLITMVALKLLSLFLDV